MRKRAITAKLRWITSSIRASLNEKGHIGFLGHGSEVHFRNIRIKEL
ncbi:MAG: hypothetical protein ACLR8Y_22500 [Alistipes indistinctus]